MDLSTGDIIVVRALVQYLYTTDYDEIASVKDNTFNRRTSDDHLSESEDAWSDADDHSDAFTEQGSDSQPEVYTKEEPDYHSEPSAHDKSNINTLVFNVKMFLTGGLYGIPELQTLAMDKYWAKVGQFWDTATFSESIALLWAYPQYAESGLRTVMLFTINHHLRVLIERKEFIELLTAHGDLSVDILTHSLAISRGV